MRVLAGHAIVPLALLATAHSALGASTTLTAARDATLYESVDGAVANGFGQYLFAGANSTLNRRRALLWFDVAGSLPAGATITSATLTLNLSRSAGDAFDVAVHRALADWGEGASDAPSSEGQGTTALAGDATWLHTFYSDQFWSAPGGDFNPLASALTLVDQEGLYHWTGPALIADVQAWLDSPAANFGWFLLGDEATESSSKRFDSRHSADAALRPQLALEYTIPAAPTVSAPILFAIASFRRRR